MRIMNAFINTAYRDFLLFRLLTKRIFLLKTTVHPYILIAPQAIPEAKYGRNWH